MKPKYFDAHGHPNFPAYGEEQGAVIERALSAGVWMNAVGTTLQTSKDAIALANKYKEGVFATVGIHPTHAEPSHADEQELGDIAKAGVPAETEGFDEATFLELAKEQKVVAIGECGLDYFRMGKETKDKQVPLFRAHIELAKKTGKPLMLHVRSPRGDDSAYRDALSILSDWSGVAADFHFFSGSWAVAKDIIDSGFHVSFDGPITFARDYDEVIRNVPLDKMMAETDCPYAAPAPYRGKRNEPSYVVPIVEMIAKIRKEDPESVRDALLLSTRRFFRV